MGKTGIAYPCVCPIPKNVPISVPIASICYVKFYHPVYISILALKLKPVIAEKAEQNLHLSDGKGCQKSDKVKAIDTKKELAKVAGVSHDTIQKAGAIHCSIYY